MDAEEAETRPEMRGGNRRAGPLAIGDDQKLCQEQRARPTAPNRGWCTPTIVVYTPTYGALVPPTHQVDVKSASVCTSCVRYRDLRERHISRMENARGGGGEGGGRELLENGRDRAFYTNRASEILREPLSGKQAECNRFVRRLPEDL